MFAGLTGPHAAARSWTILVPLQPHFEQRVVNRTQRGADGSLCHSGSSKGQILPLIGKERLFMMVDYSGDLLCLVVLLSLEP